MNRFRSAGAAAIAAMLLTASAPAMAQDWGDRGDWHHHHGWDHGWDHGRHHGWDRGWDHGHHHGWDRGWDHGHHYGWDRGGY